MIIYTVVTEVPVPSELRWTEWMKSVHIPQILQSGCFLSARLMRVLSESAAESAKFRADYICQDELTLQRYFEKFAPELREDFKKEFPDITQVTRTILRHLYTEDC